MEFEVISAMSLRLSLNKMRLYYLSLVLIALYPVLPIAIADDVDDGRLVSLLRGGGYTLYFRHTATDWSHADRLIREGDWLSCDKRRMRQLSDAGRADARSIGRALQKLKIPVERVMASPYCRTMETARLFNLGSVVATTDVMNIKAADYVGGRSTIIENARRLLATPPAAGTNTVIAAHGNVAREATPVYPGEGECVVFRADRKGGFDLIARIPPERWHRLIASAGQ